MEEEKTPTNEEASEEEDDDDDENIVPPNDEEAFARFERKFSRIVTEAEEEPVNTKFLENYTKLFDYLRETRERSNELEETREELVDAVTFNEERLNDSLRIIEADATQIDNLREEISTSMKLIDNAKSREQDAQEVIDSLRKTIANLNADIDVKNKMAQAELEENPQAAKHRETLEREKTKLISEVSKLSEKLNNALAYQEELERRTSLTDLRINDISTQLEETQVEVSKFKRNREKLELDITDYTEEVEKKGAEVDTLREQMQINQKLINKYETQLKEQTLAAHKCYKELELWNKRFTQMQNDYDTLNQQTEEMRRDNIQAIKDLRTKDEQRIKLQIEVSKVTKERELVDHRTRLIESDKMAMIEDKNKLADVVASMQRDCDMQKLETAHNKELMDEHVKERDILNRNLLRQQAVARDHQKVIKIQEQTKKRLDAIMDEHVIETRKQGKQIQYLEKERDRLMEEALEKTKRMEDTMDEIDMQNKHIVDLKKMLAVNEARYKFKQGLFDAVRADRNALQKQMQQCTAENNDMKETLKIYHRQNEQLKEGIGVKEVDLNKEETIKRKIMKENENVKIELNNSVDWVRSLKQQISEIEAEENRLLKVIDASEKLTKEQAKNITTLVNERDCLGSQLVRRNDEISLVLEKNKLIVTTLHVGEAQYEARLDDIRLLKVEIKRLRQEGFLLKKSIGNMNDFKVQLFHLERELTKERMKSKALEDELHNPMNVHRWRRLGGGDPDITELLQKTSLLQRRLLVQAVAQIAIEKELKEAENLYMNLRILISQQPGAQVQEEMNKTQKALFDNTLKIKCLVSEVNMLEVNNRQCKKNLARAMAQLREVKEQLKHEKKLHLTERKTAMESQRLVERLKGAVEMPAAAQSSGDGFPPLRVSSLELTQRRN